MLHVWNWFAFILSIPYVWAFTNTIPDGKVYYKTAFCVSILWILVLSFAMITLVVRVGCILHIDDFTMGLIFVAIGTRCVLCSSGRR